MTANISTDQNGNVNFVSREFPAWWGSGLKTYGKDENISLSQALIDAHGNFKISLVDQIGVCEGNYVNNPRTKMVIRMPITEIGETQYLYLGEVSKKYSPIQNEEFCEMFDKITETWPVETLGLLGKGETLWFALNGGEMEVADKDLLKLHFTLYDNKVGDLLTGIMLTPVRVVCQNTLSMGISSAKYKFEIKHFSGNKEKIQAIANAIKFLQEQQDTVANLFNNMAKMPFKVEDFKTLVQEILYPNPEPSETDKLFGITKNNVSKEQVKLINLYKNYCDNLGANKYSAYQTITEYEDWFKTTKGNSWMADSLFGNRATKKENAFAELIK